MKTRLTTTRFRKFVVAALLVTALAPFAPGSTASAMLDHPWPIDDTIFEPIPELFCDHRP